MAFCPLFKDEFAAQTADEDEEESLHPIHSSFILLGRWKIDFGPPLYRRVVVVVNGHFGGPKNWRPKGIIDHNFRRVGDWESKQCGRIDELEEEEEEVRKWKNGHKCWGNIPYTQRYSNHRIERIRYEVKYVEPRIR